MTNQRRNLMGLLLAAGAVALSGCGDDTAGTATPISASAGQSATATTTTEAPTTSKPATETTTETTTEQPKGDPPGTECETVVLTAAEQPAYVFIREGPVTCDEATRVMQDYYLALQRGEAPGAGGGGPVPVREWTCTSGPATDPGSVCVTDDGRKIEAEIDAR